MVIEVDDEEEVAIKVYETICADWHRQSITSCDMVNDDDTSQSLL
jgi:hypothetical protein